MPPGAEKRAAALHAVAARLAHAMHESHAPVDRMGAALGRMMRALARSARALERLRAAGSRAAGSDDSGGRGAGAEERAGAPAPLDDLEQCREALEREIAVCVESLQFHDRLMQHLAQVRGGLAALDDRPHAASCEVRKPDLGAGSVELF